MSESKVKYKLFEVYGVEMEYMVVGNRDMKIKNVVDKVLTEAAGELTSDVERGSMAWSNELISHVIEIKTNGPAISFEELPEKFLEEVQQINKILEKYDARLLSSACHPFVDPYTETVIWPHEYNEVYSLYNKIFDCRGHGWANLQSTHINLPFSGNEEFGKLHAAIRLLLPIIPALSASSPVLDGKVTGFLDTRLEIYRKNQKKIPSIIGKIIPEQVFTKEDYYTVIFDRIIKDIKPYDTENVLDYHFLNSRGAISRFDRGAIEIRIIDIQECPLADIAILFAIVEVLKTLVNEQFIELDKQKSWHENDLSDIFLSVLKEGENTPIKNAEYLKIFGMNASQATASEIWQHLYEQIIEKKGSRFGKIVQQILSQGTLSSRILKGLNSDYSHENILRVYTEIEKCLVTNKLFLP